MDRFVTRQKRQKPSDEFEASLVSSPPVVKQSPKKKLRTSSEGKSGENAPKLASSGSENKKTFQIFVNLPDVVEGSANGTQSNLKRKKSAEESDFKIPPKPEILAASGIRAPLKIEMKHIKSENLNCDYCQLYKRSEADALLQRCESQLEYNSGKLAQIQIFGKWIDIPRKQIILPCLKLCKMM